MIPHPVFPLQCFFIAGRECQLPQPGAVYGALVDAISFVTALFPGKDYLLCIERQVEPAEHAARKPFDDIRNFPVLQIKDTNVSPGIKSTVDIIGVVVIGCIAPAFHKYDLIYTPGRPACREYGPAHVVKLLLPLFQGSGINVSFYPFF